MRHRNMLNKIWEFETNEGWAADQFVQVLKAFNAPIVDEYIPSFGDFSQVMFIATKARKRQIEYVFKRYVGNDPYKKYEWKQIMKKRRVFYEIC